MQLSAVCCQRSVTGAGSQWQQLQGPTGATAYWSPATAVTASISKVHVLSLLKWIAGSAHCIYWLLLGAVYSLYCL